MKKIILIISLLLLVGLFGSLLAQEVLDRIVAVVGDQIILESELKTQIQLYGDQFLQNGVSQNELESTVLNQMIKDKLILIQAEKDTSIEITSEQVEQALDEQMKRLRARFASEEEFQAQLQKEGLTEKELRKRYKKAINDQLLRDKLLSSKISKISVSNKEVRDFYYNYQDSIPEQPEGVRLGHILIPIKTGPETIDQLKKKAQSILEMARKGEDFSELAKKYSDDPSSAQGGELGYFRKGDMVPSFEKATFALKVGEISDVVETQFGFHIIKLEDKKDDMVKAQHILIMLKPSTEDTARAVKLAQEIYSKLQAGADFAELAKTYSTDEESKKMGGDLGWYAIESLSPEFQGAIQGLEVGQTSQPLVTQFGVHLLKVLDRKEEKRLTLEEDWDTIKDMVKRQKADKVIGEWVDGLMQKAYVEIKLTENK
ncbi:MAG: peptidylprolyl isomerase [candidate division Zixibacteria bacterium]|nr:peptidylprolyl isomerase [candidate division Zixibacteria bacterium]